MKSFKRLPVKLKVAKTGLYLSVIFIAISFLIIIGSLGVTGDAGGCGGDVNNDESSSISNDDDNLSADLESDLTFKEESSLKKTLKNTYEESGFYTEAMGYGVEWQPFEIRIPVAKVETSSNPYDQRVVKLDAYITKPGPTSKEIQIPCYYSDEYESDENYNVTAKNGESYWKCRFVPQEHGKHFYNIIRDGKPPLIVQTGTVTIKKSSSKNHGYIRTNNTGTFNHFYFSESGKIFYLIGGTINHALAPQADRYRWTELPPDPNRLQMILERLKNMADNGVNFVVFFMDSWKVPLESKANLVSGFRGPGWYHQQVAFEFDKILTYAKKRGIMVQLCISNANYTVNNIDINTANNTWRKPFNIFHVDNGGPLHYGYEIPSSYSADAFSLPEFWVNEESKQLVKNKFRYVVARWGYSQNIFAWEFLTELQLTTVWNSTYVDKVVSWYDDITKYVKSIDTNKHLLTSTISPWHLPIATFNRLLELPNIDIVEYHTAYQDYAEHLPSRIFTSNQIDKPKFEANHNLFEAEYNKRLFYENLDTQGRHIHNSLWSSTFAGHAGAAVPWYLGKRAMSCEWGGNNGLDRSNCVYEDGYLEKNNLYVHHKVLRKFIDSFSFPKSDLMQVKYSNLRYSNGQIINDLLDLEIDHIFNHWRKPEKINFDIPIWGNLESEYLFDGNLWGNGSNPTNSGYHKPITLNTQYQSAGQFVIHVNKAVKWSSDNDSILNISVDGILMVEKRYPPRNRAYDEDIAVAIKQPGNHLITLENTGNGDLLTITAIKFTNYAYPLRILGQSNKSSAYLWIQNKRNSMLNLEVRNNPLISVPATKVDLHDLSKGKYKVQFFNTYSLKINSSSLLKFSEYTVNTSGNTLTIDIPKVETDIVCVIKKVN